MEDQLNRDIVIPKKRIPWLKYFFQFLIPAFFISYKATAQGKVKVVPTVTNQPLKQSKKLKEKVVVEVCAKTNTPNNAPYDGFEIAAKPHDVEFNESHSVIMGELIAIGDIDFGDLNPIKGKVLDETGRSVPFATVSVKGTKISVVADADGVFSITPKANWEKVTLVTSCIGFEALENQIVRANYRDQDTIVLAPMKFEVMGKAVVVGFTTSKKTNRKPIPLLPQIFKDTAFSKFSIYPNPIQSNSTLNIVWKQNQFGDHLLQLFNKSGQLVFSKEINISEGSKLFTINMPPVIAGNYFLKLTGESTGRSYTEKLIVK